MVIEGFFRPDVLRPPAPYVRAIAHLSRIGKSAEFEFLVDTGSDSTIIHPRDADYLNIDYRRMRPRSRNVSRGIGGEFVYFTEPATLIFPTLNGSYMVCNLNVRICQRTNSPAIRALPSLLGRDFLNCCALSIDRSISLCHLQPVNVQGNIILPPL